MHGFKLKCSHFTDFIGLCLKKKTEKTLLVGRPKLQSVNLNPDSTTDIIESAETAVLNPKTVDSGLKSMNPLKPVLNPQLWI